jgi:hypothetical protein
MVRFIEGYINKLDCRSCKALSYGFTFSGDTDMATQGLASLTSVITNELILFEMTGSEWNNYSDQTSAEHRISILLKRDDLRAALFLRTEDTSPNGKGINFQEFRKNYKPPAVIYKCPICETGEAVSIEKQTIADYKNNGGTIICLNNLKIREI